MKYLFYCIFIMLPLLSYGHLCMQDSIFKIKITDERLSPLWGVEIQNNISKSPISITDENGYGYIDLKSTIKPLEVKISAIGYQTIIISLSELVKFNNIELKNITYNLSTAEVIRPTLECLIKKAQLKLNIKQIPRNKNGQLSFYGNGYYTKIIESQQKVIHLRKEYGFFLTGGNRIISRNVWLQFYFFPTLSARSMDLACNGQDTIKKKVNYILDVNENLAYDATQRKVFESMEIIYRYTPLFASLKYFNYQWDEETSEDFAIKFSTTSGIPSHIPTYKGLCKGTLYIDKNNYRIKKISIDYFVRKFSISTSSAYKKIQANFEFTEDNICYIKECYLETIWKYPASIKNKITISELPSRPLAAKNHLIEKETWVCESYRPMKHNIKDRATIGKISFLSNFVQAPYDSLKISFNPSSREFDLNIINKYIPIEKQFFQNSMKLYWTEFDEDNKRYTTFKYLKEFMDNLKLQYYSQTPNI